jgi:hypothetical protein
MVFKTTCMPVFSVFRCEFYILQKFYKNAVLFLLGNPFAKSSEIVTDPIAKLLEGVRGY